MEDAAWSHSIRSTRAALALLCSVRRARRGGAERLPRANATTALASSPAQRQRLPGRPRLLRQRDDRADAAARAWRAAARVTRSASGRCGSPRPATSRSSTSRGAAARRGRRADRPVAGARRHRRRRGERASSAPSKLATVALRGTYGELRLFTPATPDDAGRLRLRRRRWRRARASRPAACCSRPAPRCPGATSRPRATAAAASSATARSSAGASAAAATPPAALAFREVVVGDGFGCALAFDGTLECWGRGTPALGPAGAAVPAPRASGPTTSAGSTTYLGIVCAGLRGRPTPTVPIALISRGVDYACALAMDGDVDCFGSGLSDADRRGPVHRSRRRRRARLRSARRRHPGLLGRRMRRASRRRRPGVLFEEISAADTYTCGVRIDTKAIECWGVDPPGIPSGEFVELSAADDYACGIRSDGAMVCWGRSPARRSSPLASAPRWWPRAIARLPDRPRRDARTAGPTRSSPARRRRGNVWSDLDSGKEFSCAVQLPGGGVTCWGVEHVEQGQRDRGGAHPTAATQVATGGDHACAIEPDATITCWGDDTFDQVSDAPRGSFLQLSAGYRHTCGVRADGGVMCWGTTAKASPPTSRLVPSRAASSR